MVSEVVSAPPELRVPVTMCSEMSPPTVHQEGITLPFLFPEDTPTFLPSLSGSKEGAQEVCTLSSDPTTCRLCA